MSELKPCPYCGGAAYFEIDSDRWEWVECGSCGMQGNRAASLMEDCKPKLVEAWNRRTQPAPVTSVEVPRLSDEEIEACAMEDDGSDDMAFARAIEAALIAKWSKT